MIALAALLLTVPLIHPDEQETKDFLQAIPLASDKEDVTWAQSIDVLQEQKKCPCSSEVMEIASEKNSSPYQLFLFTSFSVPVQSWLEHSSFLERAGGSFVLRGLPENSFSTLSRKILDLKRAGVKANIILHPDAFEKYAIKAVPALVVDNGKHHDVACGNHHISDLLTLFSDGGDAKDAAHYFLQQGAKD